MNIRTLKCLIADDEEQLRFMNTNFLKLLGFEIETAKDGREALEKLSSGEFDLLVTDNNMPFLDGIDVIKKIRTQQPNLKIVLISGMMHDVQCEAELLGVHCLTKPYFFADLQTVIKKAINESPFVSA